MKLFHILRIAKESLIHFHGIFGQNRENIVKCAKFHMDISDILLKESGNFAIEAFRESAKSTYVTGAFPLYCMVFPRRERSYILLIKQNQTEAEEKLRDIRDQYLNDTVMRKNVVKVVRESATVLEVIVKGEDDEDVSVRIEARGKGSAVRGKNWNGRRPDIVLMDDIQSSDDMASDVTLERDWTWFLGDVLQLGKDTRFFLIGNNLGEKCIIERMMEYGGKFGFKTMKIPILVDEVTSAWEARFPVEEVKAERDRYREVNQLEVWLREKMCMSINEETRKFKKEYFKYYKLKEVDNIVKYCNIYLLFDPAVTPDKKGCYSAMPVVGVNHENNIFVLDCSYGHYEPDKSLEEMFRLVRKWKPKAKGMFKVGIEKGSLKMLFDKFIREKQIRDNVFFETMAMDHGNRSKDVRIMALQPRYATGTIWHPEEADYLMELETELAMYPKAKFRDVIDALAYIEQIGEICYNTEVESSYYSKTGKLDNVDELVV